MKPLETILHLLDEKSSELDQWFEKQWQGLTPPPYFSCDIRHADYKMGVVDTNLFSAGFNNLCPSFSRKVSEAFDAYLSEHHPDAKTIGILAENHTRNKFYLLNVFHLQSLIKQTGRECLVTIDLEAYPRSPLGVTLEPEKTLEIHEPSFKEQQLYLNDQKIDLVLSNNDFSSNLSEGWRNLLTPVTPSKQKGWLHRKKSTHFNELQNLVEDLGRTFDFDPWLIFPRHRVIDDVHPDHLEDLAAAVHQLLTDIQTKYDEAGVSETPYVFVKNDSGTYGMGVISVSSGEEILQMNRKRKNKLFSTKGQAQTAQFILQEGIPTYDTYSSHPIEPVIYGVGKESLAGFFRYHAGKDPYESLNSPGMGFSCLCLHKLDEPHESDFIDCKHKRELVSASFLLAKLAALAAAKES